MIHKDYKIFHTYKDVLCQYLDGVNYDFEHFNSLYITMDKCRKKHPNAMVWYEAVNVRPYKGQNGTTYKTRWLADVRVIYHERQDQVVSTHKKVKVVANSSATTKIVGNKTIKYGMYIINKVGNNDDDRFTVKDSVFVGTLVECKQFCDYVKTAPECYKDRAMKCATYKELLMRTDLGGSCITTIKTAQKMPEKPMAFHSRMSRGNRYAY